MSCTDSLVLSDNQPQARPEARTVPAATLLEVCRRFGTPTYAYDIARLRTQISKLQANLPGEVGVYYSLKANPSLGLCGVMAASCLGADVASAGELVTALAAGFPANKILVSGPDKSPAMLAQLRSASGALLSIDSPSELQLLAGLDPQHAALLRLRPDFCSFAACAAGPDSRFGLLMPDLPGCRDCLETHGVKVVGFHIFSGSQVLSAEGIIQQLHGAMDQARRAADILGMAPEVLNLGGGFGVPYAGEAELDLAAIGEVLSGLVRRARPARIILELGRFLVAQAGWYLTTVIARQSHRGRQAVVVDGGTHQRADMCGLGLRTKAMPPVVLSPSNGALAEEYLASTDVLGCLSLPSDVLAESSALPPLAPGDLLAFANAGAYGLSASPFYFHGHPAPAEVAFEGPKLELLRARQSARSVLEGQARLSTET